MPMTRFSPGDYLGQLGTAIPNQSARQTRARRAAPRELAGGGVKGATGQQLAPGGVPPASGVGSAAVSLTRSQPVQPQQPALPLAAGTPNMNGIATGNAPLVPSTPSVSSVPTIPNDPRATMAMSRPMPMSAPEPAGLESTQAADPGYMKDFNPWAMIGKVGRAAGNSSISAPLPPNEQNPQLVQMRDEQRRALEASAPMRSTDQSEWAEKGVVEPNIYAMRDPYQAAKEKKVGVLDRILGSVGSLLGGGGIYGAIQNARGVPQRNAEYQRVTDENAQRRQQIGDLFATEKEIADQANAQEQRAIGRQNAQTNARTLENTLAQQEAERERQAEIDAYNREKDKREQEGKTLGQYVDLAGKGRFDPTVFAKFGVPDFKWQDKAVDPKDQYGSPFRDDKGRAFAIQYGPDGPRQVLIPGDTAYVRPPQSGGGGGEDRVEARQLAREERNEAKQEKIDTATAQAYEDIREEVMNRHKQQYGDEWTAYMNEIREETDATLKGPRGLALIRQYARGQGKPAPSNPFKGASTGATRSTK